MDVICELVGIPEDDRAAWREDGAAVAAGAGQQFAEAVPSILARAKAAVAHRRDEPGDDLIGDLLRAQAAHGDRLSDTELVTLVWHLVLAGQVPINLIAGAVATLLTDPGQLARLRDDPGRMPAAVEELLRWCGPQQLTIPRHAREDAELAGILIRKGQPITAALVAANRDPRVFADPERLDLGRAPGALGHLSFAHGPHFCLGAALARIETEVALTGLLRRFPNLALAVPDDAVGRLPDPGTWRLASLPVRL
jgi:cytochrome P450